MDWFLFPIVPTGGFAPLVPLIPSFYCCYLYRR